MLSRLALLLLPVSVAVGEVIQPMLLKDIKNILKDEYYDMEAGFGTSSDGLEVVAASTYMRGVTGKMVDWWFDSLVHTDWYKRWHPRDHVYAEWAPSPSSKGFVGGHHLVKEYIGGELQSLNISFKDPGEYFGSNWKADFAATNHSTAAVGRVSFYDFDTKSSVPVGHLLHLIHDEADGVRMRSRFWLGDLGLSYDTAPPPGDSLVPPYLSRGLQKHATEEMAILGSILPDLWRRYSEEGKAGEKLRFDESSPNATTYAGPFSV